MNEGPKMEMILVILEARVTTKALMMGAGVRVRKRDRDRHRS